MITNKLSVPIWDKARRLSVLISFSQIVSTAEPMELTSDSVEAMRSCKRHSSADWAWKQGSGQAIFIFNSV